MIHLNNLNLSFGDQVIFDSISWHIKPRERIGLVGDNGAGKTTLLKALLNKIVPDSGRIQITKNVSLGYLQQDALQLTGGALLEELIASVAVVAELEHEIYTLHETLATLSETALNYEATLKRLGNIQHEFEARGGFQIEMNAKRILSGLGFAENDFSKNVSTFSGGWQMRIALAKLLLQNPSLLLLDEPTNHLDIQTMEWLEGYLQNYDGTIIVISHDRYFLQRIVTKIVLLDRGTLTEYTGNYTQFTAQRKLMLDQLQQQYERQKGEIARLERFIERFRYKASKASQVQSRVKQLEKIKRIVPPSAQKSIHFYFPQSVSSGRITLEMENVSQRYGNKTVFSNGNFKIERNDKIALIGKNGAGKSTLCRLIIGSEPPHSGSVKLGFKVKQAFYAQETANSIRGSNSILDEISRKAPYLEPGKLRTLLGCFLFSGDDVHKPLGVLSGGEKSRLALALLLLQESNFLVLDEPTNHLDENSKAVLRDALRAYQGTLVLVSHDRYFIDQIVNKVIEIEDGRVAVHLGNYSEYLDRKQQTEAAAADTQSNKKAAVKNGVKKSKEQKRLEAEERKKRYAEQKDHETRVGPIEQKIEILETEKAEIEIEMARADFYNNAENAKNISQKYKQITDSLQSLYQQWEKLI